MCPNLPLSCLNPSAFALNISLALTLNVNHPCNQPTCCLGWLQGGIPMHYAYIGQLPCNWLVHFKSGRFWKMLSKRKAYRLHAAGTLHVCVSNVSALLETFAFWVLEAPCVFGRLLSTTSAALLYAKFITYCTQLTCVNLLCGIEMLYCTMLYPYNIFSKY